MLHGWMSHEILNRMQVILPPSEKMDKDDLTVATKIDESLSVKEMYKHLANKKENIDDNEWRSVWNLHAR